MTSSAADALPAALQDAKSWPFEEARRLIARLDKLKGGADKTVIFETGYGPSGLPHIGTFGEVARTSMVRHAFEMLTEGQAQDAAHLLLRRHGRPAQGAGQRAEPGDAARRTRQAADQRARPVRQVRELRPPQQRDAARLPRPLRLRLRVHVGDRGLQVGQLRRDACCRCSRPTTRSWTSSCRRSGRSGARPTRRSCPSRRAPAACCRCR